MSYNSTFKINPCIATDSYKLGHRKMYPKGTQRVYSNLTPRSGRILKPLVPEKYWKESSIAVGLHGLLKHMHFLWEEEFFSKPIEEVVQKYTKRIAPFLGADTPDETPTRDLHALGYLPIEVQGLPEGSRVPFGIPVFTVMNTHPDFFWLTNYLETYMSNEYWKVSTTATIAAYYRDILEDYAEKTGSPKEFIDWQAHDFSCRGMSGMMDAAISGFGHLTSFTGTDTLVAVDYAEYAYRGEETFVGGSVPASEHSVMTMGGVDGEFELFQRLIRDEYPSGVVSLVSDSYDFWRVITEYTVRLKDDIMARKPDALGLAKVVFRPDSGDPVRIVAGYSEDEITRINGVIRTKNGGVVLQEHEAKGAIACLWDVFGGTVTDKGYKLLDSHVGLIYGDSITMHRMQEILERLAKKGFASGNMVFGIGSYTYNYLTRDVLGSAVKATFGIVNGETRSIFKAPKTDNGTKHSAKGLLRVVEEDGTFKLYQDVSIEEYLEPGHAWSTYYYKGMLRLSPSLEDIRARIKNSK